MTLKLHKHSNVLYHTVIGQNFPGRLQRTQDSGNYLQMALSILTSLPKTPIYNTAEEVLTDLDGILDKIHHARNTLAVPRKRNIDELTCSKNMVLLVFNSSSLLYYMLIMLCINKKGNTDSSSSQ
jgi:hypothetical protein